MKTFACRYMGLPCDFVVRSETEEELLEMAIDHAELDHPFEYEQMQDSLTPIQIETAIISRIRAQADEEEEEDPLVPPPDEVPATPADDDEEEEAI